MKLQLAWREEHKMDFIWIFILAFFCLYIGLLSMRKAAEARNDLVENGEKTEGAVERKSLAIGAYAYVSVYVHYLYQDKNRNEYKNHREVSIIQSFRYKKEDKVDVYYDKAKPGVSTIQLKQGG